MHAVEINGAARAICLEADLAVNFGRGELYIFMMVGGDTGRDVKSLIYAIEGYAQDNDIIVSGCEMEDGGNDVSTWAECRVHRVSLDASFDTLEVWTSISNVKSVRVHQSVVYIELYDDALVCLGRLLRNVTGKEEK